MKVAIIGAGICGLYLARKLIEKGEEVTVFERRDKIGKEVCSGLFSDRLLEFIPESRNLIQNEINYVLINFPRRTLKVDFKRKFFIINHGELDRLVASLATKAGAEILLKSDFNSASFSSFDRVIGCDGALSTTRKTLKLKDPRFYLGIRGFEEKQNFSNYVETWPTKNGFIWKIPRGDQVEWGIMERPKTAKKIFDNFLAENNFNLQSFKSALIPQGLILSDNSKITLCGDAAGLTKPWSGGGVVWGLAAADLLLKNFPDLIKYQNRLKSFFSPQIRFSKVVKKLIYFLGFNFPRVLPKEYRIDGDFLL